MKRVEDIREIFKNKLRRREFTIDKNGGKVLEIISANFIADEDFIFGAPNKEYIQKELNWYNSQSRNVYDIEGAIPKIWQQVSDKDGYINSNYGWAIYSKENGEQYKNVLRKLKQDKLSRQAIMIYNRPSMHTDYNKDGMSDFMCCQNTMHYIRDNKLISVINFRSNDVRFGFINDLAFARTVHNKLFTELKKCYTDLEQGEIIWNAGSLHVYERDFKLVNKIININNI